MGKDVLSADERTIIAGRCNGKSNAQVAATMRYSEPMVQGILSRALRAYIATTGETIEDRCGLPFVCFRMGYMAGRRAATRDAA